MQLLDLEVYLDYTQNQLQQLFEFDHLQMHWIYENKHRLED